MAWKQYNDFLSTAKQKGVGHKAAQSLYRSVMTAVGRTPIAKDLKVFRGTKGGMVKQMLAKATAKNNVAATAEKQPKPSASKGVSHWERFMEQYEEDYNYAEYESSADYG